MSNFFDDNDEQEKQEQKLFEFYQVFSAEVRKKLMSKNVHVIHNVYDVLYPRTKEVLLSKNKASNITIDSSADSVRNALIAKLVEDNIDLDKFSENFRKSLLSRNKLSQASIDLQEQSDRVRKNLLSKNKAQDGPTIDSIADHQRNNLLSKNTSPLGVDDSIDRNNTAFRDNNLHKNVESTGDLERDSKSFRDNNVHKNVQSTGDLERDSKHFRDNNIHKNVVTTGDLETDSKDFRDNNIYKNVVATGDLERDSEDFRDNNIHKNVVNASISDLEKDSEEFRKNNISKNKPSEGDLLNDSERIRKDDLSKNKPSTGDLLTDSEGIRKDDLSKNKPSTSDLLNDSEEIRNNVLSKNKPSTSDLLTDSEGIRKDDLSKNKPSTSDLLTDSESARANVLSKNKPSTGDLLTDSEGIRKDDLSKNKPSTGDLLTDSEGIRADDLSKNKPSNGDLLTDSEGIRKDDLSKNKPSTSDLLSDSKNTLKDNLAQNKPNPSDLLTDSESSRIDLLAQNKPNPSDLLTDSEASRNDLLAQNKPSTGDLLTDSALVRNDNLAANVPNASDLLTDSAQAKDDLLASNVPAGGDLLTDSVPYFANNISANVPAGGDLLTDSQTYLDDLLASNVPAGGDLLTDSAIIRNDLLASNVPAGGDLLTDSAAIRNDNLAANVPIGGDLLADSISIKNDLLAKNVPIGGDLLSDSKVYRDNLLSKNPGQLGVVIEGIGTATFLGVSKVLTQGIIIRSFLESKNRATPNTLDKINLGIKDFNLKSNAYILGNEEYERSTAIGLTKQVDSENIPLVGYFGRPVSEEIKTTFDKISLFDSGSASLQKKYGSTPANLTSAPQTTLGGGYFGVDTLNPQGGGFTTEGSPQSVTITNSYVEGNITSNIRKYNLSRNLYNLFSIQAATSTSDYVENIKSNNDAGFQDLINKTIGHLHNASDSIGTQTFGSAIPRGILVENNFMYFKVSAERLLRPNEPTDPIAKEAWMNNPESMMAKTVAGNIFNDVEFAQGNRGVKHIIKTIRNKKDVDFSINYDPQNTQKYIIGKKGNETVFARQRFTIANPYKAPNAKGLIFSLKNYSSGDAFYFPPYIGSFQDSHSANWNEINFLGRPEPIYTYNNSNRDGSITFFVLTDYTQNFVIGRDYKTDAMTPVAIDVNKSQSVGSHFTFSNSYKNSLSKLDFGDAEKNASDNSQQQEAINAQTDVANTNSSNVSTPENPGPTENNPAESSVNQQQTADLTQQNNNIASQQGDITSQGNMDPNYSNSNAKSQNIYDFMTSDPSGRDAGEINTTAMDTEKRINEMVSGLMFQPAYFSGDKVDFLTRMDFLAKLTKPAAAFAGSGFSFSKPPIAHIRLGDWWDHDIVIKSVSVDYASAPWALDEGRVQPMWASITLQFNFVGPHGGEGKPVLSTDSGGIYSPRTGERVFTESQATGTVTNEEG